MKKKLVLAGLIGFVVGIAAASVLIVSIERSWKRYDAWRDSVDLMDQVNVAWTIRRGEQQDLVKRIDSNLPRFAVQQQRLHASYPGTRDALYMIQRYYEHSNIPIPTEIQRILDSMPPRPLTSCEKRDRSAKAAATAKRVPVKTTSAP